VYCSGISYLSPAHVCPHRARPLFYALPKRSVADRDAEMLCHFETGIAIFTEAYLAWRLAGDVEGATRRTDCARVEALSGRNGHLMRGKLRPAWPEPCPIEADVGPSASKTPPHSTRLRLPRLGCIFPSLVELGFAPVSLGLWNSGTRQPGNFHLESERSGKAASVRKAMPAQCAATSDIPSPFGSSMSSSIVVGFTEWTWHLA